MHGKTLRFILVFAVVGAIPLLAQSPFDQTFTALQTFFTGTFAKAAALIGLVTVGAGLLWGHSHDSNIGKVIVGIGCMLLAPSIITWLFGGFAGGV